MRAETLELHRWARSRDHKEPRRPRELYEVQLIMVALTSGRLPIKFEHQPYQLVALGIK